MPSKRDELKQKTAKEAIHEFQTRPDICAYMASLIPILPFGVQNILEPTPGDGNLLKAVCAELEKRDFEEGVITIESPKDYFIERNSILKKWYAAVIMNPPFSHHTAILDNAPEIWRSNKEYQGIKFSYQLMLELLERTNHMIALMPWFTIADSDVRLRTLKRYGIKSITALPRAAFKYARVQTCIIELERGYKGETVFKVYDLMFPGSRHDHPEFFFTGQMDSDASSEVKEAVNEMAKKAYDAAYPKLINDSKIPLIYGTPGEVYLSGAEYFNKMWKESAKQVAAEKLDDTESLKNFSDFQDKIDLDLRFGKGYWERPEWQEQAEAAETKDRIEQANKIFKIEDWPTDSIGAYICSVENPMPEQHKNTGQWNHPDSSETNYDGEYSIEYKCNCCGHVFRTEMPD